MTAVWTGADTVAAADTVGAVGLVLDGNVEFACLLTPAAVGAMVRIHLETVERDGVKESVDGA